MLQRRSFLKVLVGGAAGAATIPFLGKLGSEVEASTLPGTLTVQSDELVTDLTLHADSRLLAPKPLKVGQTYIWIIRQDAIGCRTLSYDPEFKFTGSRLLYDPEGYWPVLTPSANAVDMISAVAVAENELHCVFASDFK